MNVIEPKDFDVFHYATMAKTIDYEWWTYGPINCVGPNFLATAMGCAGWEFHHLKPLFDSAKSLAANPDPVPLKHGNRKWRRVIVVDGLVVYMGVLLFNMICSEYRLDPKKEIITERQFVDIFKKVYPDVRLYGLDDEDAVEKVFNEMGDDYIDWFKSNFGEKELEQAIKQNNLVDYDKLAEAITEADGPAHGLAGYDGKEIELPCGYYCYRWN